MTARVYAATLALMPEARSMTLEEIEDAARERAIRDALRRVGGNVTVAARELGIARRTMYRMITRYGIRDHRSPVAPGVAPAAA